MKIRMRTAISGTLHGHENVKSGDVVDVDDVSARRYFALGYAVPATKSAGHEERKVEKAVADESGWETTKVDVPPDHPVEEFKQDAPKPLDEDDDDKPKPGARAATGSGARRR